MVDHAPDVERRLAEARAGSVPALGEALEACRRYLLGVAQRELDPQLRAKRGASDLVHAATVGSAIRTQNLPLPATASH